MKKFYSFVGILALFLLTSCGQNSDFISSKSEIQNTEKTLSGQVEQKIADASKADWSKAKFENEDVDFYLPSENTISLPENLEENTLFIKPAFKNVKNDQKIFSLYFGINALLGNSPIYTNFSTSSGFEGDFGIAINSSEKNISTTIETSLTERDEKGDFYRNHSNFYGELLLETKNGKLDKMWKFSAPKSHDMNVFYDLHNILSSKKLPEKIVMDITEFSPYIGDNITNWSFPVYDFWEGNSEPITIFPTEVRAKTHSGEVIILEKKNYEQIYAEKQKNYSLDCVSVENLEGPYYPGCYLETTSSWLQNIASFEVIYNKQDLEKIQAFRKVSHRISLAPTFYGDENTREGRKGIAYNPKLPFTLPEKPTDDSALLVLDAKVLSGSKNIIEYVEGRFDTTRGFAFATISPAYKDSENVNENLLKLSDSLVQQDSFFFHPNTHKDFFEASMHFIGKKAIKGKIQRLAPGAQEPRYETFFIAKEGDFYHMQTESHVTTALYPYSFEQISSDTSLPKKFVFDISRMKDLWNTSEQIETFNALYLDIITKPTEKIQSLKVYFHNGDIREIPLGNYDDNWEAYKKEGFSFYGINQHYENFEYEFKVSNKYAKDIARVEILFQ